MSNKDEKPGIGENIVNASIDAYKITPACISGATLGRDMVIRAGTIKMSEIFKK